MHEVYQVMRELLGDTVAEVLTQSSASGALHHCKPCHSIVTDRGRETGAARTKKLVLLCSNVQTVLLKPI